MATLFANSTGNFTTAATWSLVDSTSVLDSETNTTATTTAFVSSQSFSYGVAPTIDGIAVKVSSRSAAPTGTFSVRLHDGTAAVAGTTVTINVTDIVAVNGSTNIGWIFMKFAAPVALALLTNYTVQVQSSTNAQVTLYRNATAANWSRVLRTTTTQAPAAGDVLYIAGDRTGAGTGNSYTVTMNNTTTTIFGEIQVAGRGTLDWGTAASTNYYLKIAGNLSLYTNSIYQQGTGSVPIPSTSTAKLEFSNASNVQFGFESRLGSTFRTGGQVITNNALLAADAAASATSLTTNVSTGWKTGDVIALASTTRTRTEAESKALTADASGTTLTITALTNAHSGTSPTQAELINLTRNVQIFGTSTANQAYINIASTASVDLQSTEFFNFGSATALKRGIDVATVAAGSCTINNCSMHDFVVAGSLGTNFNSGTNDNFTYSNNVIYATASVGLNAAATTGTNYTINNIIIIGAGQAAAANGATFNDLGGTITNIIGTSCSSNGMSIAEIGTANFGTLNGFTAHSNAAGGITFVNFTTFGNNPYTTVSNINSWRNTTGGIIINNTFGLIVDVAACFGNATASVQLTGSTGQVFVRSLTSNSGVTLTSPIGVAVSADVKDIYFDTCTFGVTTTHATGDVSVTTTNVYPKVYFRNCLFNSTTTVATQANMIEGGFIASAKHNQTVGNHRRFKKFGTVIPDTTIFNNASPSLRMTPTSATQKIKSEYKKVAVPNGQTAVINVFVRKSVVGDGSAYNGNQPRLILLSDPAAGVVADTVIATATNAANGAFQLLTATTPAITDDAVFQFYIDADGTTGWVNIDDWSVNS